MSEEQDWQRILAALKNKLTTPAFIVLVNRLQLDAIEPDTVRLRVDSDFMRSQLQRQHGHALAAVCADVLGRPVRVCITVTPYKNYNLNNSGENTTQNPGDSNTPGEKYKNYKGLYAKIHSDELFKRAMDWGVTERMLYACARDYGEHVVKGVIVRLSKLGDGYFRQGEPIPRQRGRLFTKEMDKLRRQRQAS